MSYKPLARSPGGKAYLQPTEAPRARPARRLLRSTLGLAPAAALSPAAVRSRARGSCSHRDIQTFTRAAASKIVSRTFPDDEDSILDTSAVAADRGLSTRALRRYAGPASTRGARRPCGAADGARGASHGYPSEFKVRRGRSCGCSIMRSDGINTENHSDKKHVQ